MNFTTKRIGEIKYTNWGNIYPTPRTKSPLMRDTKIVGERVAITGGGIGVSQFSSTKIH